MKLSRLLPFGKSELQSQCFSFTFPRQAIQGNLLARKKLQKLQRQTTANANQTFLITGDMEKLVFIMIFRRQH